MIRVETRRWEGGDATALASELRIAAAAELPTGIGAAVAETIEAVRARGDAAVLELGERFDGARAAALRVAGEALDAALAGLDGELRAALERAAANIEAVAAAQPPGSARPRTDAAVVEIDEVAVSAAGIYAPGGRAPYPSSVLMGAIPARVAGVEHLAVASPPGPGGLPHPAVLAAARIAGADVVYAIGGAQAIAALAYGTESVARVDVIAGPGSPWVQEAKLQCSRVVGIDGYAGPSELLVICDGSADPEAIALDLLAQAEHGPDSPLVVVTADPGIGAAIAAAVEDLAPARPTAHDARLDLLEVGGLEDACALAQAYAPEHVEVICADAPELAAHLTTAGCVFVGAGAAVAFGDYAAGSNHILPTGGAGRFTGPVGPGTFRRRISRVALDAASAASLAPAVDVIARAEGFPVHGESALVRAGRKAPQAGEQAS